MTPQPVRPAAEVWEEPVMRAALAHQDLGTVYRLLQAQGYSQNTIGALTGQSQPEVCGIRHGRRVRSYDVLTRIAHGLGVPPGYLGLAWCGHHDCGQPDGPPAPRWRPAP